MNEPRDRKPPVTMTRRGFFKALVGGLAGGLAVVWGVGAPKAPAPGPLPKAGPLDGQFEPIWTKGGLGHSKMEGAHNQ